MNRQTDNHEEPSMVLNSNMNSMNNNVQNNSMFPNSNMNSVNNNVQNNSMISNINTNPMQSSNTMEDLYTFQPKQTSTIPTNNQMQTPYQPNTQTILAENPQNSSKADNDPPRILQTSGLNVNNILDDSDLLEAFIGENYNKITTRVFNFSGFFFSSLYFFYRKMFVYGILLFLINLLINTLFNQQIVFLLFNILCGFFVNKIYLFYANRKIEKIKRKNPNMSISELMSLCSRKGGTSLGKAILGLLLQIGVGFLILIISLLLGITSIFTSLIFDEEIFPIIDAFIKNISLEKDGEYNGVIVSDTSIAMQNEFTIHVPSKFQNNSQTYNYDYKYNSNQGVFNTCQITLEEVSNFTDLNNFMNQMASYYSKSNENIVSQTTINNIPWSWFSKNDDFGTTYYYGTTKNNHIYLLTYKIEEDSDSDCITYKDQILNSIQSK